MNECTPLTPLSPLRRWLYMVAAWALVAFGQPAWIPGFGLLAAIIGYALFWRMIIPCHRPSLRFRYAALWFFSVQLIQLSWFPSHPYFYIYAVYFFIAALCAVQFGIIGLFINEKMTGSVWHIPAICSLWVILEWSRLFILSGFSFNPIGMALAGNLYTLQFASIGGVFGLSFWVLLTNLLALRARQQQWRFPSTMLWLTAASIPYIYGFIPLSIHDLAIKQHNEQDPSPFHALLVQPAFPMIESTPLDERNDAIALAGEKWQTILQSIKHYRGHPIDLIVLPEFVVPFGTYANVYSLNDVIAIFRNVFGEESLKILPSPAWPLAEQVQYGNKTKVMVNNGYWAQSLTALFQAPVLAGLEDADDILGKREYYSAAILFPFQRSSHDVARGNNSSYPLNDFLRYEKRVLVPMGEYIPFTFCQKMAEKYGIFGSFTAGKTAKAIPCGPLVISPSICYEETFGNVMREGRQLGAEMFVNLTNDAWYPNSRLPVQHLEHARLRTVENGIPLIRACNTGITAVVDSLGRTVAVLGGQSPEKVEWIPDSLYVEVPTYTYHTLYSRFGDALIIGLSFLIIVITSLFRQLSF